MDVTVVVPIRNEAAHIEATLRMVFACDAPPGGFEVIVCDGASTDRTLDIVRRLMAEFPALRLIHNPRRLSSAGRNLGMRAARGRYLVVIDGHCEIRSPHYLRDLVARFEATGADCLGRPQPLDVAGATPLQRAIAAARSSPLGHNPGSLIYSAAGGYAPAHSVGVAYTREAFAQLGGFDERFDACEDVEFNHRLDRAGLTCYFAPELAVHYRPRRTLRGLFVQLQRYGRGRARLMLSHPDTRRPGPLAPAALVMALLVCGVVGMAWPPLILVGGGIAGLYAMAVLLATALCRGPFAVRLRVPAVFVMVHAGAGVGVLRELGSAAIQSLRRAIRVRLTPSGVLGGSQRIDR